MVSWESEGSALYGTLNAPTTPLLFALSTDSASDPAPSVESRTGDHLFLNVSVTDPLESKEARGGEEGRPNNTHDHLLLPWTLI